MDDIQFTEREIRRIERDRELPAAVIPDGEYTAVYMVPVIHHIRFEQGSLVEVSRVVVIDEESNNHPVLDEFRAGDNAMTGEEVSEETAKAIDAALNNPDQFNRVEWPSWSFGY